MPASPWQVPRGLPAPIGDPDEAKSALAVEALMGMTKIDLAALRAAHAGA